MKLTWEPITLNLRTPFRIAHGTFPQRFNVLVRLDEGIGEAPAVTYYGETQDVITEYMSRVPELGDDPFDLDAVLDRLPQGSRAARAAIDIALHDLWGKRLGHPLYRLFGLNPEALPLTSFTIGMDTPEVVAAKVKEAEGYPILKVKLGSPDDREMLAAVRDTTDRTLRVDANEGWTLETAGERLEWLAKLGVEFVEQPLPADRIEETRALRRRSPLPFVADESVHTAADIPRLAGAFDGINIKLMKCGGIGEALRMIAVARAHGMKVMLGCMIESSLAIAAAAHISPLVDTADLDGHLLIDNDPFVGPLVRAGQVILPDDPGLGVAPRT